MSEEYKETAREKNRFTTKRIAIGLLIAASILFVWYLSHKATSLAEENLLELANRELEPGSELIFGDMNLGFFPPRVTINDARLVHHEPFEDQTPEKPLDTIRFFEMEQGELKGFSLWRLIAGRELNIGSLEVEGVQLDIVPTTTDRVTDSSPLENPLPIVITDATLTDSRFRIFPDRQSDSPTFVADSIKLSFRNLKIDDPDAPVYDYFDTFRLEINEARQLTDNGFYELTGHGLIIDSDEKTVSLERFRSNPLLSAYELTTTLEHEEDRFDITGGPFRFDQFDITGWLETESVKASFVDLQNLEIVIERDKTSPNAPRSYRELPHSQFASLPFSVEIDSIRWSDGLVSYSEQYKEDDRKGTIRFSDVNLMMFNLQNRTGDEPIRADATAHFMDKSDLNAEFRFYPADSARHEIRASLSEMDLSGLNNPLEHMAGASVRYGIMKSFAIDLVLTEELATGVVVMTYSDLEVRILDEETLEERTRDRIASFFTNTFAVRSENPEDDPRKADVEFERDKERSMFNYWWNSIKEGLLDIVMR